MRENFSPSVSNDITSRPLPIILGLGLPTIVALYFYVSYANTAWFWQDDFGFIAHYANSIQWNQLFDFSNFGRFLVVTAIGTGELNISHTTHNFFIF